MKKELEQITMLNQHPKSWNPAGHFVTMVMISDPSNSDSLNSNSQSPYPLLQHKFQLQGPNLNT